MKIRYGLLLLILAALLITAGYAHSNTIEDSDAVKWSEKRHRAFIEKSWNVAIFAFDKATLLNPNYTEAYFNRGLAYSNLGNYNQAIADYNKAITLNPKKSGVYCSRGNAYSNLGNYSHAIAYYNKAIDLDPKDADPYNNRAITYLRHGDNISGCRDAQKACDLGNCNGLDAAKAQGFCH